MEIKKNFAWPVTILCKFDYKSLKECIEQNKDLFHAKKIIIFGAGIRGTVFSVLLEKFGFKNIIFTDNNESKIGGMINKYDIIAYNDILSMKKEDCVVIISVENGYTIKKQLENDGFIENKNYFYIDTHLYDMFVEEYLRGDEIDTIIFGDCGVTDISMNDTNFTNLSDMLKNKLDAQKTKVLAIHAMNMCAFYHVLNSYIKCKSKPKKIAIMANFETFTGKQHILPRSQHSILFKMLNNINKDNDELRQYANLTKERFDNFKMDYFTTSTNEFNNNKQITNDKIVLKMNYMYSLKEDNECIIYMKKIIELCKLENIKLLFFIPPANYMYAQQLFGDSFKHKYEQNVHVLTDIFDKTKTMWIDLSYVLTSSQFADLHTIDETANYEGREIVSDILVEKLKTMEA